MSVTLDLDLPDKLLKEAQLNGLLTSQAVADMIDRELHRRKAAAELGKILDEIRTLPGEPMSEADIQKEVDEVRKARRSREVRS